MEDFVNFKLAQKLKEKGFTIPTKSIFGMYNEIGVFHTLTTSADYDICDSGFKCRCYYDYDDFDERDFIAPTISQVLKWLREEKKISIEVSIHCSLKWMCSIYGFGDGIEDFTQYSNNGIDDTVFILYETYEQAALAGIEYTIDNLM